MPGTRIIDIPTADRLLHVIRISKQPVPFVELCKREKLSPESLHDHLAYLADCEYKLVIRKERVEFRSAPDLLTAIEIQHGLKTKVMGRQCHSFASVKSTNDHAAQLADQNVPEGTIVTAEQQTKGRGRLGRVWHSPAGLGIYLSMILRPSFPPDRAPGLSILTGLALVDAIRAQTSLPAMLKWPNDVYLGDRKCAGILTELSAERGKIHSVIVGVGINVNHGVGHFPEELRTRATSLRRALKRKVSRVELLQQFLLSFEKKYAQYQKDDLKSFATQLKKLSYLLGREIELQSGVRRIGGRVNGIDSTGRLILETPSGIELISAGEVTVVK